MLNYQYNLKELLNKLEEQGETDAFIRDIFRFSILLDEYFGIEETLFNPRIVAKSKLDFLEEIISPHVGNYFKEFLINLINNDDINYYPLISKKFLEMLEKEKGSDYVEVTSAEPLKKEQMELIQKILENAIGHAIYIYNSISESLIGGFLIKLGSRTIDCSIRKDLENFKFSLS